MGIFEYFRRYTLRKQRRAEITFNTKMAEMTRKANAIKRNADRLKAKALEYEQKGDHASAVSTAAAAMHQEKNYRAALETMQTCRNMHEQVKSQNALKDLIATCTEMARSITADANVDGFISAQNALTQTMDDLQQSSEALTAVQEGFTINTDMQVRNEAGEQALAQIMAELAPKAEPVRIEEPRVLPAVEAPVQAQAQDDQHKEWADDRRKILAALENA